MDLFNAIEDYIDARLDYLQRRVQWPSSSLDFYDEQVHNTGKRLKNTLKALESKVNKNVKTNKIQRIGRKNSK